LRWKGTQVQCPTLSSPIRVVLVVHILVDFFLMVGFFLLLLIMGWVQAMDKQLHELSFTIQQKE